MIFEASDDWESLWLIPLSSSEKVLTSAVENMVRIAVDVKYNTHVVRQLALRSSRRGLQSIFVAEGTPALES